MDDVAGVLAGLLARAGGDAGPGPGDGITLSCVPGALAAPPAEASSGGSPGGPGGGTAGRPGELRWELLVTRGGAVVREVVATDPAVALRTALDGDEGDEGGDGDGRAPRAEADPDPLAAQLAELGRVAAALPLVVDLDAVWDLAPDAAGPAWRWTVAVTRWDVLVEGSVLRWEADTPAGALALALADLADDAVSR